MRLFILLASIFCKGFYIVAMHCVKWHLLLYVLNLLPHNFTECPLGLFWERMRNPFPFIQLIWFMIVQISLTFSSSVILSQIQNLKLGSLSPFTTLFHAFDHLCHLLLCLL